MGKFEINRHAGAVVALGFLDEGIVKREMWFDEDDLMIDDPVVIPGRVKITVEYDKAGSTVNRDACEKV